MVYDSTEGPNAKRHIVGTISDNQQLFIEALEDSRYITYVNNHAKVLVPETIKTQTTQKQKEKGGKKK